MTSFSMMQSGFRYAALLVVCLLAGNRPVQAQSFQLRGAAINGSAGENLGNSMALSRDGQRMAAGIPNSPLGGVGSGAVRVYAWNGGEWVLRGNPIAGLTAGDGFGGSVALDPAGEYVAAGSTGRDVGTNLSVGSVRVFQWDGTAWVPLGAELFGPNAGDQAGSSVALAAQASAVVIGLPGSDRNGGNSGMVRVYFRNGDTWTQAGQDIAGEAGSDSFGQKVAISDDGRVIAVSAPANDGGGSDAGSVRVYAFNGSTWVQRGRDLDGTAFGNIFGRSVSLTADGSTLAVGAPFARNTAGSTTGHVRVYDYNGTDYVLRGATLEGGRVNGNFGAASAISPDGFFLAVGSPTNATAGTGAGMVQLFEFRNGVWIQTGPSLTGVVAGEQFGISVAVSTRGRTVAGGANINGAGGSNAGQIRAYDFTYEAAGLTFLKEKDLYAAGDTVRLTVRIGQPAPVWDLFAAVWNVTWDNDNLVYLPEKSTAGGFLGSDALFFQKKVDGQRRIDLSLGARSIESSSGFGDLAYLTFYAVASGKTRVALEEVRLEQRNGAAISSVTFPLDLELEDGPSLTLHQSGITDLVATPVLDGDPVELTFSAEKLAGNLKLELEGADAQAFELSANAVNWFSTLDYTATDGEIPEGRVFVRIRRGLTLGEKSATLRFTSPGLQPATVPVSGFVRTIAAFIELPSQFLPVLRTDFSAQQSSYRVRARFHGQEKVTVTLADPGKFDIWKGLHGIPSESGRLELFPVNGIVDDTLYYRLRGGLAPGDYSVQVSHASALTGAPQEITLRGTMLEPMVFWQPSGPSEATGIELTVDLRKANSTGERGNLEGYSGDVYLVAGLATDRFAGGLRGWPDWDTFAQRPDIAKFKLTRSETQPHLLSIRIADLRSFFGVTDPDEKIYSIQFVFRNLDGTLSAWDMERRNFYVMLNTSAAIVMSRTGSLDLPVAMAPAPSDTSSYVVRAANLGSDPITITLDRSDFFEIRRREEPAWRTPNGAETVIHIPTVNGRAAGDIQVRTRGGLAAGSYTGTLTHTGGGVSVQLTLRGEVRALNMPAIVVSQIPNTFTTETGQPSPPQSYTVSGTNLTAPLEIVAPAEFSLSLSQNGEQLSSLSLQPQAGTVPATDVWVRLRGTVSPGTYANREIVHSSAGAISRTVLVQGTVTLPVPFYNLNPNALTGLTGSVGTPSSVKSYSITGQNITADMTVSASLHLEIAKQNVPAAFATDLTFTPAEIMTGATVYVRIKGSAPAGAFSGSILHKMTGFDDLPVGVSGTISSIPQPQVVFSGAFTFFDRVDGWPSTLQTFVVSGSNLTADMQVEIPSGWEGRRSGTTAFGSNVVIPAVSGTIPETTVEIRIRENVAPGPLTGTLAITSAGAEPVNIPIQGRVFPRLVFLADMRPYVRSGLFNPLTDTLRVLGTFTPNVLSNWQNAPGGGARMVLGIPSDTTFVVEIPYYNIQESVIEWKFRIASSDASKWDNGGWDRLTDNRTLTFTGQSINVPKVIPEARANAFESITPAEAGPGAVVTVTGNYLGASQLGKTLLLNGTSIGQALSWANRSLSFRVPSLPAGDYILEMRSAGFVVAALPVQFKVTTVSNPTAGPANNSTNNSTTQNITWAAVPGATSYELSVATLPDLSNAVRYTTTGTSYMLVAVPSGTRIYWAVRAFIGAGAQPFSPVYNYDTAPSEPVAVAVPFTEKEAYTEADYRMIFIPGEITSLGIKASTLFSGANGPDWRMFRDPGAAALVELKPDDILQTNVGYWVLSKQSVNVNRALTMNTNLFPNRVNGWNIVGNPGLGNQSFPVTQLQSMLQTTQPVWAWNGSGWQTVTALQRGVGYYVRLGNAKAKPAGLADASVPAESPAWEVELSADNGGAREWVRLAEHAGADAGEDGHDWFRPRPRFITTGLELDGGAPESFIRDVKPVEPAGNRWTLTIERAEPGIVNLSMQAVTGAPGSLWILMPALGRKIHLSPDAPAAIPAAKGKSSVTVFRGDAAAAERALAEAAPSAPELLQNYPNPFNPSTRISFALSEAGAVRLTVTDLTGRTIATLVQGSRAAGYHHVDFNAAGLASGLYLYRLETPGRVQVRKMVLLK